MKFYLLNPSNSEKNEKTHGRITSEQETNPVQIPHPSNATFKFPPPQAQCIVKCLGYARGGMLKFRIDRRITRVLTTFQTRKCWEKNKNVIYLPRSVRIGKNCALGLEYGPRPVNNIYIFTGVSAVMQRGTWADMGTSPIVHFKVLVFPHWWGIFSSKVPSILGGSQTTNKS